MTDGATPRRDESVSFSLRELMKLEDERVRREREEREQRALADARAREEDRARVRAEAEARARAEEEARAEARRRELDDLARREAMHRAAIEQTRIAVEARPRGEEANREREHEIALARIRAEGPRGRPLAPLAAALGGAAVALLVAGGAHLGLAKPAADRRAAELAAEISAESQRSDALAQLLFEQRTAASALEGELGQARGRLAALERERAVKPPPTSPPRLQKSRKTRAAQDVPCQSGDPMCFTLDAPKR
jgi:hypothetical protein